MTSLPILRRLGGSTILGLALVSCGGGGGGGDCGILSPTRSITASPASLAVDVGKTTTTTATFTTSCSSDATAITAASSNSAIMTVSQSGGTVTVTGVAAGSANITLTAAGPTTNTVSVTVKPLVATTITVAPANDTLSPLGTRTLTATVRDQNGALLPSAVVVWRSLTSSLASVSSTGLVTAIANGTATIQGKVATGTGTDSLAASTNILIVAPCTLLRPIQVGTTYSGRFDASSCRNTLGFPILDQFSLTVATQTYYSMRLVPSAVMSLVPLNIGAALYGIPPADTAVLGFGVIKAGTSGFMVAMPTPINATYTVTTALNPDPRSACVTTDVTRGVSFNTALLPSCTQRDVRVLPAMNAGGRIIVTASSASFPVQIDLQHFDCSTVPCVRRVVASAAATINGGTATIDYTSVGLDRFVIVRVIGPTSANDNVAITVNP